MWCIRDIDSKHFLHLERRQICRDGITVIKHEKEDIESQMMDINKNGVVELKEFIHACKAPDIKMIF